MAIVGTDEEDKKATTSQSPNAVAGSGGAMIGGGGGVGGPSTSTVANPTQGNFVNLNNYLEANQDTGASTGQAAANMVQGEGEAAKAAGNTYNASAGQQISDATQKVGTDAAALQGDINSGTAKNDPNVLAKINAGSGGTSYTGPTDFSNIKYGGPAAASVAYGGPTSTGNFSGQVAADQTSAIAANQKATADSANAAGPSGGAGQSALLKSTFQNPNYTVGENSLDSFLVGGTPGGQTALAKAGGVGRDVSNNYAGINSALEGKIGAGQTSATTANAGLAQNIKDAGANSDKVRGSYEDYAKGIQGQIAENQKQKVARTESPPVTKAAAGTPNDWNTLGTNVTNAAKSVVNVPKNALNTISKTTKRWGFSEGGEVPSYSRLSSFLEEDE